MKTRHSSHKRRPKNERKREHKNDTTGKSLRPSQHKTTSERPKFSASRPQRTPPSIDTNSERTQVRGALTLHPRGFGFVSAEDGGPDVFIPEQFIGAALHQDRVLVETWSSRQGREGRVLSVLDRGLRELVGVYQRQGKNAWLELDDPRLPQKIDIVDAPKNLREGAWVRALITRYPGYAREPVEAAITEELDPSMLLKIELDRLLLHEGVATIFPSDVIDAAKHIPSYVLPEEMAEREDLRDIDILTIDPVDAKDHDDALFVTRHQGGFRVVVAIADVSHYVRAGDPIDREALRRACTVYLPDRAVPMLPHELSSHLASLVPNQDRLALAIEAYFDKDAALLHYRYLEAVICSRAKLSYESVAQALNLYQPPSGVVAPALQAQAAQHVDNLRALYDLSRKLREKRMQRGSLDFDLPEAKVRFNEQNTDVVDVVSSRQDAGIRKAYNMVEEMMLFANERVATDLAREQIAVVYRVHGTPNPEKLAAFVGMAQSLGHNLDPRALSNPSVLATFLKSLEGQPQSNILSMLLLRAMQQAVYQPSNIGHYGLALEYYTHFTSPIRRYPDLVVHRILRSWIRNTSQHQIDLHLASNQATQRERRAMRIERDAVDLCRAALMSRHIDEIFTARVSTLTPKAVYFTIMQPFVEVGCPMEELTNEPVEIDDMSLTLRTTSSGRTLKVGDEVQIRILSASIITRKVIGHPLGWNARTNRQTSAGQNDRRVSQRPGPKSLAPKRQGATHTDKPAQGKQQGHKKKRKHRR